MSGRGKAVAIVSGREGGAHKVWQMLRMSRTGGHLIEQRQRESAQAGLMGDTRRALEVRAG